MKQNVEEEHFSDPDLNPAGGYSMGKGFLIKWQNGPLGRGDKRQEPNGAFVEGVILAAIGRLLFYQGSKFKCDENYHALKYLEQALDVMESRTKRRENEKTEGTHTGS